MLDVYCWRCGTQVSESDVLGLGHFNENIGKYQGKAFIAFKCPKCHVVRYQILDTDVLPIQKKLVSIYDDSLVINNSNTIDLNQVIDFHKELSNINTVDNFIEKCEMASNSINIEINKPIIQPLDVYNLFSELNRTNLKRLMILILEKDNYLLAWEFLGEGTNKPISFDPKIVFHTPFLIEDDVSIIIAHNIKEKFTQPSQEDILHTKRLIKAGKVLGIELLDHIIIENDSYHSFDQLNLL
jgi:DNA repair protein RadC